MAKTAKRRFDRYVKGARRLAEDRQEHGEPTSCGCFEPDALKGRGYTFSVFADRPKLCSGWCCGNPRRHHGNSKAGLTRQELRTRDWKNEV